MVSLCGAIAGINSIILFQKLLVPGAVVSAVVVSRKN